MTKLGPRAPGIPPSFFEKDSKTMTVPLGKVLMPWNRFARTFAALSR
jgi:hypothetical protein